MFTVEFQILFITVFNELQTCELLVVLSDQMTSSY